MKIAKTWWIYLLWLLIVFLFFSFQSIMDATSQDIWVKPVPVDPRDIFRGEYVRLQYDFSTFDTKAFDPSAPFPEKNRIIYAVMKEAGDIYQLDYFTTKRPSSDRIFLRGFIAGRHYEGFQYQGVFINFNLESYFVPEGKGPELEKNIGDRLKVKIRVNRFGWARIIDISTQ